MQGRPLHIAVGNINIDISMVVERIPGPDEAVHAREAYVGPGGAASNYAVAAARAGHRARLVARTGPLAEKLGVLEALRRSGVDTSGVVIVEDEMPGVVIVLIGPGGERSMIKLVGANRLLDGSEAAGGADVLHAASVRPSVYMTAASRVEARITSYDPGSYALRDPEGVRGLAGMLSVLYLNRAEFRSVAGEPPSVEAAGRLASAMKALVVVKLGSEGAMAVEPGGRVYIVGPYRPERVVDTTGAGDVFAAFMNAWLAEGRGVGEALAAAAVAAGLKVARRGAQSAPSREEVEEVISEGGAPQPRLAGS